MKPIVKSIRSRIKEKEKEIEKLESELYKLQKKCLHAKLACDPAVSECLDCGAIWKNSN